MFLGQAPTQCHDLIIEIFSNVYRGPVLKTKTKLNVEGLLDLDSLSGHKHNTNETLYLNVVFHVAKIIH